MKKMMKNTNLSLTLDKFVHINAAAFMNSMSHSEKYFYSLLSNKKLGICHYFEFQGKLLFPLCFKIHIVKLNETSSFLRKILLCIK